MDSIARRLLHQEARALLTRLARVKSFALYETMVPAASASIPAQSAIERYLSKGRRELRQIAQDYLAWLDSPKGRNASPAEAQRKFTILRMRFNTMLSQFDIFADVMTQRSEHETGAWLAGLDVVAADALALPEYYQSPAVVCYLDRGHGAAIRRARTRLPGGGENPVAIIRVPRERMVSSGVASSLVHEVGHQGAAQLDLINSLQPILNGLQRSMGQSKVPWQFWSRWISEILSDFWSVARVGVASTLGLMGVVSLPRAFVFRLSMDDPHPVPWIRLLLSAAMGDALFPHPQWRKLADVWKSYYPLDGLDDQKRRLLEHLEDGIPSFTSLLVHHRPAALRGKSLLEVMAVEERQPARLSRVYTAWQARAFDLRKLQPSLVFAVLGQARVDGRLGPEEESRLLAGLLTHWALRQTLDANAACAGRAPEIPAAKMV